MKQLKLLIAILMVSGMAHADRFDSAKSKNAGNYVETYSIALTTTSATKIIDSSIAVLSAAVDVFPNGAYAIFVGTNTSTLINTGFPVLSSTTYTTDGTYTGDLYGTAAPAAGTGTNVRVIYWLKNDALR